MDKETKPLNNAQRKALAQLLEKSYERLIKQAQDNEGMLVEEITQKVKVELGVDTLENQIKALELQIENLQDKKKQLGFSEYGLLERSKAKMLIDTRLHQESSAIQDLEQDQTEKLAAIWTAQSIEETKALLKGIVK